MTELAKLERGEMESIRVYSHDVNKGWSQLEDRCLTLTVVDFEFDH